MELKTVISKDTEIFKAAAEIRRLVFIEEQGFSNEFDNVDKLAYHAVIFDGETPVACGRYYGSCDPFHIGRIAVIPGYRGKGVGAVIMKALEEFARENGAAELTLSAQTRAAAFYEKLGFRRVGEEYPDESCPHIEMRKQLG